MVFIFKGDASLADSKRQDSPAALRGEVALDAGDQRNQSARRQHDFDHIVDEELDAAARFALGLQSAGPYSAGDQAAQPIHAENLILTARQPCDLMNI